MADLGFEPKSQEPLVLTTVEAVISSEVKDIRLLKKKVPKLCFELFCLFHLEDES